jgi:hypothetical protein
VGSSNFFSKVASMDPLAQALDLPGAHKYAQQQAQDEAGKAGASGGPYTGVAPTLAAANAGYAPGGPGATQGWAQYVAHNPSNFFQRAANVSGNVTPQPSFSGGSVVPTGASLARPTAGVNNSYVQPSQTRNPYADAAGGWNG